MLTSVFPISTQSTAYCVCMMESLIQCTKYSTVLIFPAKPHSKPGVLSYFVLEEVGEGGQPRLPCKVEPKSVCLMPEHTFSFCVLQILSALWPQAM